MSNADKKFLESAIPQMINHIVNKNSPNWYDSFYRKLSKDSGNPNQSQQHLDIGTSSKSISNTFAPPKDDIRTPVTAKQMEEHEHKKDLSKMEARFSNLKSSVLCEISALGYKIEEISNSVNTALKNFKNKDNKNTGILIYWEKISLFCNNNNYNPRMNL